MRKTLVLTQREIKHLADMKDVIRVVEQAFRAYGEKKVRMPAKIYLDLPEYNGDFRAMPAYVETIGSCGIKWVCSYASNRKYGLPSVMAHIILNDPKDAYPLAILEGTHITNLRTGAAGAVAAKYLARKDSKIVSLVGCGVQAEFQLLALNEVFSIEKVKIWGKSIGEMADFKKRLRKTGLNIEISGSIKECVADADIICTTTPSRKPLVMAEWLKPGAHINAIGADAPGKQELDPKILKIAKIIVDDYAQASHSGEINLPLAKGIISKKNISSCIGDIVAGKKEIKCGKKDITVFDSTGLAIQDIALASFIYKKALKNKKGTSIELM
jgi:alanine dehydrogenase